MEENKKKDKNYIVVIVTLVFIILCLLGGILFLLNNKDNNTQSTQTKEENTSLNDEVTKLTNEEAKEYIDNLDRFMHQFARKIPLKTNELSNQDLLWYAYYDTKDNSSEKSKELYSQSIQKLFGSDFAFQMEDMMCLSHPTEVVYQYNTETGLFEFAGHGHGGVDYRSQIYYLEGSKYNNRIEIKTKVIYGNSCFDSCGPITSFYASSTSDEPLATNENYCDENDANCFTYDKVYEQYKEQLPITTFIYTKQSDGSYGLTEVKVK